MDRHSTFGTFSRYLKTRPHECWWFFIAGFVLAAILT